MVRLSLRSGVIFGLWGGSDSQAEPPATREWRDSGRFRTGKCKISRFFWSAAGFELSSFGEWRQLLSRPAQSESGTEKPGDASINAVLRSVAQVAGAWRSGRGA
jgi:hypothetical protein